MPRPVGLTSRSPALARPDVFILAYFVAPLLAPFVKVLSTPKRAERVFARILLDTSGRTGVYYDEAGHPMQSSALVRDPKFQDRVVAETRALLAQG